MSDYIVYCVCLVALIVLSFCIMRCKFVAKKKDRLTLLVILLTGACIAWQAYETQKSVTTQEKSVAAQVKSVAMQEYAVTVQNQPFIGMDSFYCRATPWGAIRFGGQLRCYGNTPAHEFNKYNDLVFYIPVSGDKLKEYNDNKEKPGGKAGRIRTGWHFYVEGILEDICLKHIMDHPDTTYKEFKEYLSKMRDGRVVIENEALGNNTVSLVFDEPFVFGDVEDWYGRPTVLPPGVVSQVEIGRDYGDTATLFKNVENLQWILIYYSAWEYEGLAPGEKLKSHYLGYLHGPSKMGTLKINGKQYDNCYVFKTIRMWGDRTKLPGE